MREPCRLQGRLTELLHSMIPCRCREACIMIGHIAKLQACLMWGTIDTFSAKAREGQEEVTFTTESTAKPAAPSSTAAGMALSGNRAPTYAGRHKCCWPRHHAGKRSGA